MPSLRNPWNIQTLDAVDVVLNLIIWFPPSTELGRWWSVDRQLPDARQEETWWWNEEVATLVKEKQRLFKLWKGPKKCKKGCRCWKTGGSKLCGRGKKAGIEACSMDMETRRQDYNQARGEAKRAIFKAKNDERKRFCENLERKDEKGNLFRVAKQLVNRNRDIEGANGVLFFRMPLNPIRQTFIPRPYIFMPLLSFYRTSFNRLCSVRSESHIKHLFVAFKQKETKTFTVLRRGQSKTRNFIQDPGSGEFWIKGKENEQIGSYVS